MEFSPTNTTMKIDLNKKYTYKIGGIARVLCTDAPGTHPVISIGEDGELTGHFEDGHADPEYDGEFDLIEIPEAREPREVLLYCDSTGGHHWVVSGIEPGENIRFREILPEPTTESTPVSSSLTLEVGKWYENRRGDKVGPLEFQEKGAPFVFTNGFDSWTKEGRWAVNTDTKFPKDLIREIQPPSAETSAFPEVGARLRVVKRGFLGIEEEVGTVLTVLSHGGDNFRLSDSRGPSEMPWEANSSWREGFELVTEPAIPTGFPPVPETPVVVKESNPEESRAKAALGDGWLWFGRGPLKVKPDSMGDNDLAGFNEDSMWVYKNWSGNLEIFYAIRAGTDLAKDNGLEPAEPRYEEVTTYRVGRDRWPLTERIEVCGDKVSIFTKKGENLGDKGYSAESVERHSNRCGWDKTVSRRIVTETGEVKRWNIGLSPAGSMVEVPDGGWVRYSDHLAAIEALTGRAEG